MITIRTHTALTLLALFSCGTADLAAQAQSGQSSAPLFVDRAAELGLDFHHHDFRSGAKYYVETAASGGGFLDFDDDGDLDVYLLSGAPTPGAPAGLSTGHRLFEQREGRFVDVTARAGVGDTGFGMGMCTGDIDGDGRLDLMVTNYGPDRLYRNLGDGRFEGIGAKAGVADERWSTGCAFGDLDGDGDLDLYVAHYVDFVFAHNPFCGDRARNLRAYCRPEAFDGVDDSLFLNQGDGRFVEAGGKRGIARGGKAEKGFGVLLSDFDNDGDLDIYVANDGTANRLYINDGKGFFIDQALIAGVALGARGQAESGMGVAAADLDGNLFQDLLVTNYSLEPSTLYLNQGELFFEDATRRADLFEPTYKFVGWGAAFFDFDLDGDLDLAIASGHAVDNIEIFEAGLQYRERNLLLENRDGRFVDRRDPGFAVERVSRALAVGDVDNDGALDLLITNTNDPVELLMRQGPQTGHWLGLKLVGPPANRQAIGARVRLEVGGKTQTREVRSGGSFLSQQDLRLHFGLGKFKGQVEIEIRWPDGRKQKEKLSVDAYHTLTYR